MTPEAIEVTLGRHSERLRDLEERADKMDRILEKIASNTNKILGGVSIACVLLVVNAVIMLAGKI